MMRQLCALLHSVVVKEKKKNIMCFANKCNSGHAEGKTFLDLQIHFILDDILQLTYIRT